MYENKKLLLLSACLLLHAHVSDKNVPVDDKNLSAFQTDMLVRDTSENSANFLPSVSIKKSIRCPATTVDEKRQTLGHVLLIHKEDDAFRDTDRLEEKTDAVTAMLQQQLFAPHNGNLILQTVKNISKKDPTASAEKIAVALKVRLAEALKNICLYDPNVLDTLTMQLAEVICSHGMRQKRPLASLNPEDIQCMTAGLYHVLQDLDVQRLIVF